MKNKLKMAFVHGSVGSWPSICHCIRSWMFCSWRKQYLSAQEQSEPTIMDKSPWDSNAIFIFFLSFRVPRKTVHPFRNFPAVFPPLPYTKKKFWIHAPNIVCGVRERDVGPVWIGKRPEMQKCPKTFVHDCSSFNFHLLRTSRKSHFNLFFFVFLLSTIGLNGSRVGWLHVRWSLCVLCRQ